MTNKSTGENQQYNTSAATINYKNKHYTVNGTRLDETAWNNSKHNNRRYQNTQHQNGRNRIEDPQTEERI